MFVVVIAACMAAGVLPEHYRGLVQGALSGSGVNAEELRQRVRGPQPKDSGRDE